MPKTSTIFVTHTKKKADGESQDKKAIFTLENISKGKESQGQDQEIVQNRYDLLARLRGHRNTDPPTICYVA